MNLVKNKKWGIRKKHILITNNNISNTDKIVIYKKKEKSNLREIKTTDKSKIRIKDLHSVWSSYRTMITLGQVFIVNIA